jgi:hypothetical protein
MIENTSNWEEVEFRQKDNRKLIFQQDSKSYGGGKAGS